MVWRVWHREASPHPWRWHRRHYRGQLIRHRHWSLPSHRWHLPRDKVLLLSIAVKVKKNWDLIWAASWQNQQNGMCVQQRLRSACASAQSDQSFCYPPEETLGPKLPIECSAKTLIRLGGCPGWSKSSLCAQFILLFLSCCGSNYCWYDSKILAIVVLSTGEVCAKEAG